MNKEFFKKIQMLLQSIGLLFILCTSFVGGLYMFNGNMLFALPFSLFFVVAMYYLVGFFIKQKELVKRRGYSSQFYYMAFSYFVMASILSFFVLHFFNVEIGEKENIKKLGYEKLDGLEAFYEDYSKQYSTHCDNLQSNINAILSNPDSSKYAVLLGAPYNLSQDWISGVMTVTNRSDYVKRLVDGKRKSFNEIQIDLLSNKDSYFTIAKATIDHWNRLSISSTINDLDKKLVQDFGILNSALVAKGASPLLIDPQDIAKKPHLMDQPVELAKKHLGAFSVLVVIGFNLLILLPFLLTPKKIF